jgi:hypothetical protein
MAGPRAGAVDRPGRLGGPATVEGGPNSENGHGLDRASSRVFTRAGEGGFEARPPGAGLNRRPWGSGRA